ncbi:hypothetical protein ACF0H5_010520 [Mactra antiquata]
MTLDILKKARYTLFVVFWNRKKKKLSKLGCWAIEAKPPTIKRMASASEMDEIPSPPKEKCDSDVSTNGNEKESKIGKKRNKNMKNNQTKETTSTDSKSVNRDKEEDQPQAHKKEESFNSDNENPDKKGSQPLVHETEGSDPINSDNPENTDGQPQSHEKEGSDPLSSEQMTNEEAEQLSQDGKYYEAKTMDEKTKSLEDEVVRLSNENETLKTTTESLKNVIKDKDTDIDTFKSKIQELSEQHKRMKKCINEQELNIQNYKKENQDKTLKIQHLENNIKEREVDINTFRSKIQELHKQHSQSEDDVARLSNENDTLKTMNISIKEHIKEARASIKYYKEDNEEKREKLKQCEDEIMMLNEKNEKLTLETERAKHLESVIQTLNEVNKCLNEDIANEKDRTDKELEQLTNNLQYKEQELKQLKDSNKCLVEDLCNEKKSYVTLSGAFKQKEKAINTLEEQLKRSKTDKKTQTERFKREQQKLQDQIKQLNKDLLRGEDLHKTDIKKIREDSVKKVESLKARLTNAEQAYNRTSQAINRLQNTIDFYKADNESKRQKVSSLEVEKENLLLRLSRITGAQLTYNNPNIADLSDDKRPTKLAEEFSELYDNEWTDAYECTDAENDVGKTEVLYNLLKQSYEFCENLATGHDEAIRSSFTTLTYTKTEGRHGDILPKTNDESRDPAIADVHNDGLNERDSESIDETSGQAGDVMDNTNPHKLDTESGDSCERQNLNNADGKEKYHQENTMQQDLPTNSEEETAGPGSKKDKTDTSADQNIDVASKDQNDMHVNDNSITEIQDPSNEFVQIEHYDIVDNSKGTADEGLNNKGNDDFAKLEKEDDDTLNDDRKQAHVNKDCYERQKRNAEMIEVSKIELKFEGLSAEQKKTITDLRKLCEVEQTADVVKKGSELIAMEMRIDKSNTNIIKYISKCIDICWSMRRHEPPVYVHFPTDLEGLPLDTKLYRPYTKSGKLLHFVVWPVLYLHEGGPLLSKGVAQGRD